MGVDLEYVNRKKRQKRVAIVGGIASIVLIVFIIVAFLGRNTGTFSAKIVESDVDVRLAANQSFENPTSSLIDRLVDDEGSAVGFTTSSFSYIQSEVELRTHTEFIKSLDDEDLTYRYFINYKGEVPSVSFYKYTFYVKNFSTIEAGYTLDLKLTDTVWDRVTSDSLDDIIRVGLIETELAGDGKTIKNRNVTYYAKTVSYVDPTLYDESVYEDKKEFVGEPFFTNKVDETFDVNEEYGKAGIVATKVVDNFVNQIMRYTVFYWLEGSDTNCNGKAPENCSLNIGVQIRAYED